MMVKVVIADDMRAIFGLFWFQAKFAVEGSLVNCPTHYSADCWVGSAPYSGLVWMFKQIFILQNIHFTPLYITFIFKWRTQNILYGSNQLIINWVPFLSFIIFLIKCSSSSPYPANLLKRIIDFQKMHKPNQMEGPHNTQPIFKERLSMNLKKKSLLFIKIWLEKDNQYVPVRTSLIKHATVIFARWANKLGLL